jgi:hypothetical protein
MKSLFDLSARDEIIARINRLRPDSKAEWGKMNASQMLAHLSQAFRTASGELKLKRVFIGKLFGSFAKKKFITGEGPFSKNSPTDKTFIITGERDFDKEKEILLSLIEKFCSSGIEGVSKDPHPFFGTMTPEQWDILMMKHLDHHLRQFGV